MSEYDEKRSEVERQMAKKPNVIQEVLRHGLPTDDTILDDGGKPLPPNHAEKCRMMAADMANVERLLYRLANGDRDAAMQLQGLSNHVPYDGAVIMWRVDNLIANVLE